MSDELKTAIKAAKFGAATALKYFNKRIDINYKKDRTPVTIADQETEADIKKTILDRYPDATFLAEESASDPHGENFWMIDPIDGTANYINMLPFWGSLIAFVKNGEIIVGVSYSPLMNELVYAERGSGAFMNTKRIHVSKVNNIKEAFFLHGTISYFKDSMDGFLSICNLVRGERGYGDFYGYHQVACGKADIMMEAMNGPWDIAAIKVIIEEAGGRLTNHKGDDWKLEDPNCLATNGMLHDEVLKILNEK